jgi:peptidoglycan/LPS O-acetylase OafA/YrhL
VPALVVVEWSWRAAVASIVGPDIANAHVLHVYSSQLPGTLDGFAFGIALALAISGSPGARRPRLLAVPWRSFAFWCTGFLVIGAVAWNVYWPRAGYWDQFGMNTFWRTLPSAVFGCLAAAAVTFPRARSWLLRPLRYLGEISYGIYLWHLPVLLTMVAVPWFKQERLLWLMLAGTLAIAAFSWHFFEKPFIRRSHRG